MNSGAENVQHLFRKRWRELKKSQRNHTVSKEMGKLKSARVPSIHFPLPSMRQKTRKSKRMGIGNDELTTKFASCNNLRVSLVQFSMGARNPMISDIGIPATSTFESRISFPLKEKG